jgi:hypothetical protein
MNKKMGVATLPPKKTLKNFAKSVDKHKKVWYNILVNKG